jgi:predicted GNAT superfamily acetyltransferase
MECELLREEVAADVHALDELRAAHVAEMSMCEAERRARVAAEQMLSEREAATRSILAARDGELACLHEHILRLNEDVDTASPAGGTSATE